MEAESNNAWFVRHLRTALNSLYDPSALRHSPLVQLFGLDQRADAVSALRRILIEAIESLQPTEGTPRNSKTWRVYQILRRRYTEQLGQREVGSDLGLSIRQLQREEHLARQVLADSLWAAFHLETGQHMITSLSAQDGQASSADEGIPTRAQELEWLRDSVAVQTAELGEVVRDVLSILDPLVESLHVSVEYLPQPDLPRIAIRMPMFRQALLDVVSEAVRRVPGGQVRILADAHRQHIKIQIDAGARETASVHLPQTSLEMAEQLVQLCGGELRIMPVAGQEQAMAVEVTLPSTDHVTVLVIDDNADALQLLQRYLSNSRYRFIGTQDAQRGLVLAEEASPHIILLDVMMPERDGWTVLGQLREHPKTRDVPVIMCSILSQEQLALTLGAAQFLRKPVSRQALLLALDRQLDSLSRKPC